MRTKFNPFTNEFDLVEDIEPLQSAIAEVHSRLIKLGYVSPTFDHPATNELKDLMAVSDGTDPDEWLLIRVSIPFAGAGSTVNWSPNGIFYKNSAGNLVKVPQFETIGSIPEGTQIFARFSFRYYATIILTDNAQTRYFFEEVTPLTTLIGSDEINVELNNVSGEATLSLSEALLTQIEELDNLVNEIVSLQSAIADIQNQIPPIPLPTMFSHFIEGITTPWGASNSGTGATVDLTATESGITGIARLSTGSTATGRAALTSRFSGTAVTPVFAFPTFDEWEHSCRFKIEALNDGANDIGVRLGWIDTTSGGSANGAYLWYLPGQANWQIASVNAGNMTQINTSVPVNTNWNTGKVLRTATKVEFYINDSLIGEISTNLPSSAGAGAILTKGSGTTPRAVLLDWMFAGARA